MYHGIKVGYDGENAVITGKFFDKPNNTFSITVPYKDYVAWRDGTLIQDAMPYLNTDEREILISGLSPEGFDNYTSERGPQ